MNENEKNWWPWVAGLVAILLIVFGIPFIAGQTNVSGPASPAPQGQQGGGPPDLSEIVDQNGEVSIMDINLNPGAFEGMKVNVEGEVDKVYARGVFKLDQEGTVAGDEILVISRNAIPLEEGRTVNDPLKDADDVRVKGTVQRLVVADIENELDLDLDQQIEEEFENKTVIIADEVNFLPENR